MRNVINIQQLICKPVERECGILVDMPIVMYQTRNNVYNQFLK